MNINIETLLGRSITNIQNPLTIHEIKGKTILVTGAAGSIGSEIVKQVLKYEPSEIILIDQSESGLYDLSFEIQNQISKATIVKIIIGNITDEIRMSSVFRQSQPETVFHAAAYKHVPLMEDNPYEAVKVNIGGTRILAKLSIKYRVSKFIMISTDKAVNPSSVMGITKKMAEMYLQTKNDKSGNKTKFIITRFGNVVESNGSVIPLFRKQIEAGGPVTITDPEITRYFITIPEAGQFVLESATMGMGGEVFVFDMGKPIKITEIANKMIELSGNKIKIQYVGMRSGEKLHEELLNYNEIMVNTYHPKIKNAKSTILNNSITEKKIDELFYENSDDELKTKLKNIIEEYNNLST